MKNVLRLLKKSFVGIPVAIFLYEIFNLTLSIIMKQYVKIDGFNLQRLIYDYIEYGIAGYGYAFILNYIEYNLKNSDKNGIQTSKSTVNLLGIVMIAIILIVSTIEGKLTLGLVIVSMISLLVIIFLFVIFLFDKKDVKNINKRIQENKDERD